MNGMGMTRSAILFAMIVCWGASITDAQTVWYVDDDGTSEACTSWDDACPDLQRVMADLAQTGDQIWVAVGVYRPDQATRDRSATFALPTGVETYGGFAGDEMNLEQRAGLFQQTQLSGDLLGNDVADLAGFLSCFSGEGNDLLPGCEGFDLDKDNDVDAVDGGIDDNSYHVTTGNNTGPDTVLDGFTIIGGNADGGGIDQFGGGMLNFANGDLSLSNCRFITNTAVFKGGGLYNINSSDPMLSDCTFEANRATGPPGFGGGMANDINSSPMLTDCIFTENLAGNGAGIYSLTGSLTLTDCVFVRNAGTTPDSSGGALNLAGTNDTVIGCRFIENSAGFGGGVSISGSGASLSSCRFLANSAGSTGGGGVYILNADPTLVNCLLVGNTAAGEPQGEGGGLHNCQGSPTVLNCTFGDNHANTLGGGVFDDSSAGDTTISNCIFWDNSDGGDAPIEDESAQIHHVNALPSVTYSVIEQLDVFQIGVGNIADNPMFVEDPSQSDGNYDFGNLRLQAGSPCIDSGNNNEVPPEITTDLDGNSRFVDDPDTPDCPQPDADCGDPPVVDMGVFEFFTDCNNNGVPDQQDIAEGTSQDCDNNAVPDECDIFGCPADVPNCSDCNLNGIPDACDIEEGAPDKDGNGIPDECVEASGSGHWTDDIWGLDFHYPDNEKGNEEGVPGLHVTLDGMINVFLDATVEIESLRILPIATLTVTQVSEGDLTVVDAGGIMIRGELLVARDRMIDASAGAVTIGAGGRFGADLSVPDTLSASLIAESITILEGPNGQEGMMVLEGSMMVESRGRFTLDGTNADDDGSCTPPDLSVLDSAQLMVSGDFEIIEAAQVEYASLQPMTLQGDFVNHAIDDFAIDFDWLDGELLLAGDVGEQTIEAAGEDRGTDPAGFEHNFAIGALTLDSNTTVRLVDVFDNQQDGLAACDEVLYVSTLTVRRGSVLITSGCKLYYGTLIDEGGEILGLNVDVLAVIVPCPADLDSSGNVGASDLAQLLGAWGTCSGCPADFDGDGSVGASDLAQLLGSWGRCP